MTPLDIFMAFWLAMFTAGYLYGDYKTCDGGAFDAAKCAEEQYYFNYPDR